LPSFRIIERTPSRVDLNVAPFRPSKLLETLAERGQVVMKFRVVLGMRHQHADPPFPLGLLRVRDERPRGRRAAEQRDELATFHSITSSASANNLSGISRPSAFAVLRLIRKANFVDCCTGKSAGFSPLRTRPA